MIQNFLSLCFCGISACFLTGIGVVGGHEAIIGGDKAVAGEFPFYALVFSSDRIRRCGGAIIHEKFVLTAAHCVTLPNHEIDERSVDVVVGTIDLNNTHPPAQIVAVHKIYVSKEFNRKLLNVGDIAVLKLRYPLKLSRYVQSVELAARDNRETYRGQSARIPGFGVHGFKRPNGSSQLVGVNDDTILRWVDADIVSRGERGYVMPLFDNKHLCARTRQNLTVYHKDRGVCIGDSGGPLVQHGNTVIGILSLGPSDCIEKHYPAVYTRVSFYRDFIENAMNDKKRNDILTHTFS